MGSNGAAGGPSGPDGASRARGDAVGSRMGPHINRTPIYVTVKRSVEPRRVANSGFRRKPVGTRYGPTGPDEP